MNSQYTISGKNQVWIWLAGLALALALIAAPAAGTARAGDDPLPPPVTIPLTVTARGPSANALNVLPAAPVTATFSTSLDQATVSTATFTVRSSFSGVYEGAYSFPAADRLEFAPAQAYKPGETLFVTASSGVTSTQGDGLQPYTWQFTAATLGGTGIMAAQPVTPTLGGGASWDAALGDLDGDGDLDAVVSNYSGQAETIWLNNGSGGFVTQAVFGAGSDSAGIALGDLDGDGDLDLVVANDHGQAETVWLNDGSGAFNPHPTTPAFGGSDSSDVALGDLDGDGDLDAVVANTGIDAETVWLNNGSGVFTAHPSAPAFGSGDSYNLALGDLDGDGDLDALVANRYTEFETIWLNDGSGVFTPHPTTPAIDPQFTTAVALGDLDGDGDLDAVFSAYQGYPATVWLNDGAGSFSPPLTAPSFGSGISFGVALGDLDGDGDLDAILAEWYGQPEVVWLNDGAGHFSPRSAFGAGNSNAVALGDLDGDGDLDAVTANWDGPETVWLNAAAWEMTDHGPASNRNTVAAGAAVTATFTANLGASSVSTATFTVRSEMSGVYTGTYSFPAANSLHFNPAQPYKAGETVFVTASSGVSNLQGVPLKPYTWQFTAATSGSSGVMVAHPVSPTFGTDTSTDAALGDLDGDGDLDAVVVNGGGQAATVWLNNGQGQYSAHSGTPSFASGGETMDITLGDLDGDGDLDAVAANDLGQAETVWLNDGSGAFSAAGSFGAGNSTAMALGDLDGDGDLDALVANSGAAETVWLNDGAGGFGAHPITPGFGAGNSFAVALGDLDGDGDLDALVANYSHEAETVWLNDGTGSFSAHLVAPEFGAGVSWDVALGDLDGDGDLDALVVNTVQLETVWLNDGSGVFSPHPSAPDFGFGLGMHTVAASLGDLDGDGDLDAVLAAFFERPETVWLNDGSGAFSAGRSFGAGSSTVALLGDLDGDGDLDAVTANSGPETVWLNASAVDLSLQKTASTAQAVPGTPVVFTLAAHNAGPVTAEGLVLTDTLPAGLTYVSSSPVCANTGGQVVCTAASLAAGADISWTITASVDANAFGVLTNTALLSASPLSYDALAADNRASAALTANNTRIVYQNGFDTGAGPGWCPGATATDSTPAGGRQFLGQFGNQTACLTLSGLAPHQAVQVSFDVFVIRSWNGSLAPNPAALRLNPESADADLAPDRWLFSADGTTWVDTTFSNLEGQLQAYPANFGSSLFAPFTGAAEQNTLGYLHFGRPLDAVYRISLTIPHTASTLQLDFSALGLQGLENESWGLDNLTVKLQSLMWQVFLPLANK